LETHKKYEKTQNNITPIRKYSTLPGPWTKSDKEKAEIFPEHLPKFSLHMIMIRIRKWNKT